MMTLKSPAFKNGQAIPKRFTGEGDEVSPMLAWSGAPAETKSYALICEDPDAPIKPGHDHPFVHWLAYNIDANITTLPEGIAQKQSVELPVFLDQGKNSFGNMGYGGPMPPEGHGLHHYHFTVYALNCETGIPAGLNKSNLLKYMGSHVLDSVQLIGTFERKAEIFAHLHSQNPARADSAPFKSA